LERVKKSKERENSKKSKESQGYFLHADPRKRSKREVHNQSSGNMYKLGGTLGKMKLGRFKHLWGGLKKIKRE